MSKSCSTGSGPRGRTLPARFPADRSVTRPSPTFAYISTTSSILTTTSPPLCPANRLDHRAPCPRRPTRLTLTCRRERQAFRHRPKEQSTKRSLRNPIHRPISRQRKSDLRPVIRRLFADTPALLYPEATHTSQNAQSACRASTALFLLRYSTAPLSKAHPPPPHLPAWQADCCQPAGIRLAQLHEAPAFLRPRFHQILLRTTNIFYHLDSHADLFASGYGSCLRAIHPTDESGFWTSTTIFT